MTRAFLTLFAAIAFATSASAQTPELVTEEMMVRSPDAGVEIFVRNKRPAAMTAFRPERTVLFVHGATYPAHTSFDLKLDGRSWIDYIASRGYDVYLLDVRGYGKSTRPKEMADDAKNNQPIVRGDTAVKDIGTVVNFIVARRNIPRLNLVGWSWGTTLMATYTTQNASRVERLVLYAPSWIRQTPSLVQAGLGPLGAYRTVRRDQALTRWLTGVPEDKKATLIPAGWFDAWADATFASDPEGAKMNPTVLVDVVTTRGLSSRCLKSYHSVEARHDVAPVPAGEPVPGEAQRGVRDTAGVSVLELQNPAAGRGQVLLRMADGRRG